jgi:hypothetical protein
VFWHLLVCEYEQDVRQYRGLFAAVDRRDPASLRAWFDAHSFLTSNDQARIAEVSLQTVRRWKRLAGLPAAPRRCPSYRRPARPAPAPPADWRAGTWLAEQYPSHSIREIARAIGRSYTATRRQLRRRGVAFPTPREAVRSRHPCCTRAWLFDHYMVRGLSVTRCARLAGVSRSTLTGWLLSFQFGVRCNTEQQLVNYEVRTGRPLDPRRRPRFRRRKARARARELLRSDKGPPGSPATPNL